MADFSEMANTPIDMTVDGKVYKVRQLRLDSFFGKSETAVISEQMKRIREIAATLESSERVSFLAKALAESIPSGRALRERVAEYLDSMEGAKMVVYDALRTDQPNIEKELDVFTTIKRDRAGMEMIVSYAMGKTTKVPLA